MIASILAVTPSLLVSVMLFVLVGGAVGVGLRPVLYFIAREDRKFDRVLRGQLLLDIPSRLVLVFCGMAILVAAIFGYIATASLWGGLVFFAAGLLLPSSILKYLQRRRRRKLEDQLVPAVQTLASGVRAGLNLVQSMQMVARDAPAPIRQEFAHLIREYEYGVPLDQAMLKAADRIDSGDFRLLFSALHTHRERGGDLGETLDRIAESIREIQRLEKRVHALTAQGRATARWMGAMPIAVLAIIYFLVDSSGVRSLFTDDFGKVVIAAIIALNVAGFLWIRKTVQIDI